MENKKDLEKLLEIVSGVDELFDMFNNKSLRLSRNYQIASLCYNFGGSEVALEKEYSNFKDNPNYQKTLTRIKIMKNKLYQEAQRRDIENAN